MIKLNVHFKSSNSAKGAKAELGVKRELELQGYSVKRLTLSGTDLVATNKVTGEVIRIEVKFSSQGKDGKFRATTIKRNATDHRKSDVIVMVCQPKFTGGVCTSFIVPTSKQGDKSFMCITSNPETYSGIYSQYREAWHLIGHNI